MVTKAEILAGSKLKIGKAMTLVESENDEAMALLESLEPETGKAVVVGVTGPPGSGKSTLTAKLALYLRKQGKKVGILAVDPSSPFSGGAILGDRIRMNEIILDPGIFIRSMSTRGHLGGLSRQTNWCVKVLDAAGYDVIIVETVGVGQSEVDIIRFADTVVVVCVPGMGDDIQAIKAGILEIADIFVINKADHEGANRLKIELEQMLLLDKSGRSWQIPILQSIAVENKGMDGIAEAMANHFLHLQESGELKEKRKNRLQHELEELLERQIDFAIRRKLSDRGVQQKIEAVYDKKENIYGLTRELLSDFRL